MSANTARANKRSASEPLQELLLATMAYDADTGAEVVKIIGADHFSGTFREMAKVIIAYREQYGGPPGPDNLVALLSKGKDGESERGLRKRLALWQAYASDEKNNPKFVLDRAFALVQRATLTTAIVDAGHAMETNDDLDGVVSELRQKLDALPQPGAACQGTRARSIKEFIELPIDEPEMLMSPWLEASTSTMIHAGYGAGKTLLATHIAECLADCRPALSGRWLPERPMRVLFVDGELPPGRLKRRVKQLAVRHYRNLQVVSRRLASKEGRRLDLLYSQQGRMQLDRDIAEVLPEVVIVDSVFTVCGVTAPEKELERWHAIHTWMETHQDAGRAIIFLHHNTKGGVSYGSVLRSVLVDTVIELRARGAEDEDEDEEESSSETEKTLEVRFRKTRNFGGRDARPFRAFFKVDGGVTWRSEDAPGDSRRRAAEERRALILARLAEEVPVADIAREAECSMQYVYNVRARFNQPESRGGEVG